MNTIILCAFFISPPPANAQQRNAMFGVVVHNQNAYTQDSAEFKFAENKFAYRYFKQHPSILQMNSADDSLYQKFYVINQSNNVGLFEHVNDLIFQNNISAGISLNSTAVPSCTMDANTKMVNDVYLRTWAEGISEFISADSTLLYDIAIQDPLLGGSAVYGARVMLGIDPTQNTNRFTFAEENNPVKQTGNTAFGYIYPNPNSGMMQLDYELEQGQKGVLIIYNAIGQKMNSYYLVEGINSIAISEAALENGIYFYDIKIDGVMIQSDKIVIIK